MVFACCVAFVCVMLRDFAPEMGSCQEWVGSILAYIGVFAGSAMVCFVAAPNLLIFVTRGIHGGGGPPARLRRSAIFVVVGLQAEPPSAWEDGNQ
uniref:Uncharacterized protein n=1 Tax=Oryza glumipatula TaxID=40148 RepID=A0A0E0AVC4_9ORYZ